MAGFPEIPDSSMEQGAALYIVDATPQCQARRTPLTDPTPRMSTTWLKVETIAGAGVSRLKASRRSRARRAGSKHPVSAVSNQEQGGHGLDRHCESKIARRVLVVEDEALICVETADTLEHQGFEVHVALSGEEALRRLRGGLPIDILF